MRITFKSLTLAVACAIALTACGGNTSSDGQTAASKHLGRSEKLVAADYADEVQELYISYYNRPADPAGLAYWEGVLLRENAPTDIADLNSAYSTNPQVNAVVNGFGNSAESLALYGTGNATTFVTAIYNNALGRLPDTGGLDYWTGLISANKVTQAQAALAIIAGATIEATTSSDEQLVSNRLAVATYFTAQVAASQNATNAYSGGAANSTVRTMLDGVTATTDPVAYETTVNSTISSIIASLSDNIQPITVDAGPDPVNSPAVNEAFTSVTICDPANPTQCQTIDHILVDTGSSGLRIIASVLSPQMTAALSAQTSSSTMSECTMFVDGYTWGPIRTVNFQIAGESANNMLMQVIGDPNFSTVPSDCSNNGGTSENTVDSFGANGVIGVGLFQQDCGAYCVGNPSSGYYYACTSATSCTAVGASLTQQLQNPVSLFAYDNNGVIISLPTVSGGVANSTSGTMTFGVGTRSNNTIAGSATIFPMNDIGNFNTIYQGNTLDESFIDSGSNGLYFPDSSIPTSSDGFFNPPVLFSLSATMQSVNSNNVVVANEVVPFSIGSIDTALNLNPSLAVYVPLGAPNPGDAFDWGLPFFFGRNVIVVTENQTVNGQLGPFNAF